VIIKLIKHLSSEMKDDMFIVLKNNYKKISTHVIGLRFLNKLDKSDPEFYEKLCLHVQ
jgi:hypothetical protein